MKVKVKRRKGLSYCGFFLSDSDYRMLEDLCDKTDLGKSVICRLALRKLIEKPDMKELEKLKLFI